MQLNELGDLCYSTTRQHRSIPGSTKSFYSSSHGVLSVGWSTALSLFQAIFLIARFILSKPEAISIFTAAVFLINPDVSSCKISLIERYADILYCWWIIVFNYNMRDWRTDDTRGERRQEKNYVFFSCLPPPTIRSPSSRLLKKQRICIPASTPPSNTAGSGV